MDELIEKGANVLLVILVVTFFYGSPWQIGAMTAVYIAYLVGAAVYYYRKHPEYLRWKR